MRNNIAKELYHLSGIYEIVNLTNSKRYIGSTTNFAKRFYGHRRACSKTKSHNLHLQRAVDKYGIDCFSFNVLSIIMPLEKESKLDFRLRLELQEDEMILKLKTNNQHYGYNIRIQASSNANITFKAKTTKIIYTGEEHPMSKLTERDVLLIKELIHNGIRFVDIAKSYGLNQYTVRNIASGKTWGHVIFCPQTEKINRKKKINIKGTTSPFAKLNVDDVRTIKTIMKTGIKQLKIAEAFCVSPAAINSIAKGKNWKHVQV